MSKALNAKRKQRNMAASGNATELVTAPKNIVLPQKTVSTSKAAMAKRQQLVKLIKGQQPGTHQHLVADVTLETYQSDVFENLQSDDVPALQTPADEGIQFTYDQMKVALEAHLKLLSDVHDVPHKIELKRKWLPEYQPYIEQYLAGEETHPNIVLVWMVIWSLDIEAFTQAISWAEVAIDENNNSPDKFRASLPEIVCDTLYKWCETEVQAGRSCEPWLSQVVEHVYQGLIENSGNWRVNEVCGSKLLKLYASELEKSGKPERALVMYEAVMALPDGQKGCKGHIDRVNKLLNGNTE